jgi:thioredoxin 1
MSDSVTQVSEPEFDAQVLQADRPVLVDFWAEWCTPCHMVSPAVEAIAREHGDRLKTVKVNIDDNPDIAMRFGIMSIPTLIVFKEGREQARLVGARGKEAILKEIERHFAA